MKDLGEVRVVVDKMVADGKTELAVNALFGLLEDLQRENRFVNLQRRELLKKIYGRSSERIDPNQLALVLQGMRDEQRHKDAEDEAKTGVDADPDAELPDDPEEAPPKPKSGLGAIPVS